MGHWGTGIASNDTFMEVYETFFHYYNHNLPLDDIRQRLKSDFAETIDNPLCSNDYWFALAKALWECKALDSETFGKVKSIVENREDLKVWKALEASDKDLKARELVLQKFLLSLSAEKDKARARKKISYYSGYYDKGTCLTFKMKNGMYGGFLVIEKEINTLSGKNYVLATDIQQPELPGTDDFLNAKVLSNRHTDNLGYFREYFWKLVFEAKYKRHNKDIEQYLIPVGHIPIEKTFEDFEQGTYYCDRWTHWIDEIEGSIKRIKDGEKENMSSTVKEWIGK